MRKNIDLPDEVVKATQEEIDRATYTVSVQNSSMHTVFSSNSNYSNSNSSYMKSKYVPGQSWGHWGTDNHLDAIPYYDL